MYLEEDLAVGLMIRLLFAPLFHDATVVGRLLSFLFRSVRILIGMSAFSLVTISLAAASIYWFLLPVLAIILTGMVGWVSKILLFCGVVLFVDHIVAHPQRKVWQIKLSSGQVKDPQEIWKCSFVKKGDSDFSKLLKLDKVKTLLRYLEQRPQDYTALATSVSQKDGLMWAWELGKRLGEPYLLPEHFFVAELLSIPNVENYLLKLGTKIEDFTDVLDFLKKKRQLWRIAWVWDDDFHVRHLKGVNRGWLGVPTPQLDRVSEDLTRKAARDKIDDFIGRADIVSQVVNILSLEKGRNVLLIGEAGSGRTALVDYLAKIIVSGDAPAALATKRLVKLDTTKLLTEMKTQGDLAERIQNIFEEVKFSGNIIIFIDEIQNLGIGEAGSQLNLYSLLLPYIEGEDFQFIATTEDTGYHNILAANSAFARLFAKVELPSATVGETLEVLKNKAVLAEQYKGVKTTLVALKDITELTNRYIHDKVLPDSAVEIFNETVQSADNGWVHRGVVEKVIGRQVHVPVVTADSVQKKELLNLEDLVHQRLIDQEEAVAGVAKTLRRAATQLRDQKRPIGSFLFVGPTGVGKTELAKILADVYFQGSGQFLRFDMSEYQNSPSVDRLLGKPGEEGSLTEAVNHNPYSLILLDEFEKADPKILTLFLQVLDDGRLTDQSGKTVDFTSTIIIATSNAGSLIIAEGLKKGKALSEVTVQVNEELLKALHPELVNRFDEVVLFKPLSPQDLQKIVRLKLSDLQNQLKNQGYLVEFNDQLIAQLAQKGYDPILGARPLRRLIQDTLEAKLSTLILEDKLPKGQEFRIGVNHLGVQPLNTNQE